MRKKERTVDLKMFHSLLRPYDVVVFAFLSLIIHHDKCEWWATRADGEQLWVWYQLLLPICLFDWKKINNKRQWLIRLQMYPRRRPNSTIIGLWLYNIMWIASDSSLSYARLNWATQSTEEQQQQINWTHFKMDEHRTMIPNNQTNLIAN